MISVPKSVSVCDLEPDHWPSYLDWLAAAEAGLVDEPPVGDDAEPPEWWDDRLSIIVAAVNGLSVDY